MSETKETSTLYGVQEDEFSPVNFFAGEFPIVTDVGDVAEGCVIRKYAPVAMTENGIAELAAASTDPEADASNEEQAAETSEATGATTAGSIENLCGIAAADSSDGKIVYYLTGEFFGNALVLPEGVTPESLKPAFRKQGIYLK